MDTENDVPQVSFTLQRFRAFMQANKDPRRGMGYYCMRVVVVRPSFLEYRLL